MSQYEFSDSEATNSEAPSAFLNEDDSIMSESVDIMDSTRSARSLTSEYSVDKDSSMQRLVDNLNDVDNKFGSFIHGQTTRISSANSQATEFDGDVRSLQDELNGARLSSPANSILVETVDEESCHQSGLMNTSTRGLTSPAGGASTLGNIQEEGDYNSGTTSAGAAESPFSSNLDNIHESRRSQQSEPTVVETVDEASCHESGIFGPDYRRRASNDSTQVTDDDSSENPQEEFDPSYYKKRETQPPSTPSYDGYETASTAGGFSNADGMGATTENQWDNLQSTLDQQTDQVRKSPYYNTPSGNQEAPFSPTGNANTEGLRQELDSVALAPPVTATHSLNNANRDVETAPQKNDGTYWQGDKKYDEEYDDELLDVSLGGAAQESATSMNGKKKKDKNPTQSSNALRNFVGDEAKYQLVVKSMAGCICCMIIWTLAMIIVLAVK